MGGKMGDTNPGEDKEAGVDSYLLKIGEPLLPRPPQIPVPFSDMAGSRAEPYTGNRSVFRESHVLDVFAYRLGITKVVMLFYEAPV